MKSIFIIFFILFFSQLSLSDENIKEYRIAFVDFKEDKRYSDWGIHPVDIRSKFNLEKRALRGAELAILESKNIQRLTKINFILEHIQFKNEEDFLNFFSKSTHAFNSIIIDANRYYFILLKNNALIKKNIIYFNVSSSSNSLRNINCFRNFFHTYPSNLMFTDSISQYLVEKKWNKVLLLTGPLEEDKRKSISFRLSGKKFGLKIIDERFFVNNNDPRIRDKNNLSFLTLGRSYNSIYISDIDGEFSIKVPNATNQPSIVTGASGLVAKAWHWSYLRHGAPQLNGRFERENNRRMEEKDWSAWIAVKTIVEAGLRTKSVNNESLINFIRSKDFRLDGSKGISLNYRKGSNQLRQPLLLVSGNNWVTEIAPLESFSDSENNLDTLGEKMKVNHYVSALLGLTIRETTKFIKQKGRLLSSIVRPALWLFVFAAGVGSARGIDPGIINFYPTQSINYFEYITPGLLGMVLLFSGMQSSLSMVYDREMGVMKILLTTPLPRWFILLAKLIAGTFLSVIQAYCFLLICLPIVNFYAPFVTEYYGWLFALPAIILFGIMLGALGLLLSVYIKQLENFAGTMNFVIFPMFFISSALYPLWRLVDNGATFVYFLAQLNPFTYGVEMVRAASLGQIYYKGCFITFVCTLIFFLLAIKGYDPQRSFIKIGKKYN